MTKKGINTTYAVYSPGGNITAIVSTTKQKNLASQALHIMESDRRIEQVGFLQAPKIKTTDFHLQMMGGEFCANAARCSALQVSRKTGKKKLDFTVSGFTSPIFATIKKQTVILSLPDKVLKTIKPVKEGCLVDLQGIRFLVVLGKFKIVLLPKLIRNYKGRFPAMGVVAVSQKKQVFSIRPWVWVRATKTFFAETGCASGSLATAAVLNFIRPMAKEFTIKQPSGSDYKIVLSKPGKTSSQFVLSGSIKLLQIKHLIA